MRKFGHEGRNVIKTEGKAITIRIFKTLRLLTEDEWAKFSCKNFHGRPDIIAINENKISKS